MVSKLKQSNTTPINTMVIRFFVAILLAFTFSAAPSYSGELNVSVDRSQIYENETVELTIMGNLELELNFSNLLSLRNLELPAPDVGNLTDNFEIIDQQQKYNIQSINGENNAAITWVYTIAPKKTGSLTIPEFKFKEQTSTPITVNVLAGKGNPTEGRPPLVFLEAEVDKQQAYVQEQLIYTLRLYYADNLASGDLSNPELSNAIIEQVGDQKKYYRMRHNQRYEVIERKFLIFPQQSGELSIAPQTFSGTIIDTRARKRRHVRDRSPEVKVTILPPASEFTGRTWLPAISLNLSEKWDKAPENLTVGDSLTRTISVQALGLLGSALPPIELSEIDYFKQYPDQPATESKEHQAGVQSSRTDSIAMVAIKEGVATLPEVRIPWWDTINGVERVAIIPSRQIPIGAGATASTPKQPNVANQNPTTPVLPPSNIENAVDSQAPKAAINTDEVQEPSDNALLYGLILLLAVGWITTTVFLLRRTTHSKETARVSFDVDEDLTEKAAFQTLINSVQQKSPQMLGELVQWAKLKWPEQPLYSIADVKALVANEEFSELITQVEAALYASKPDTTWSSETLALVLNKIRSQGSSTAASSVLPSLYPTQ